MTATWRDKQKANGPNAVSYGQQFGPELGAKYFAMNTANAPKNTANAPKNTRANAPKNNAQTTAITRESFIKSVKSVKPQTYVKTRISYTVYKDFVTCDQLNETSTDTNKLMFAAKIHKKTDASQTPQPCEYDTKFFIDGKPVVEQAGVSVHHDFPEAVVVRGPLHEVYGQKNTDMWETAEGGKCNLTSDTCYPVADKREMYKVDEALYNMLFPDRNRNQNQSTYPDFLIEPSWGGTMKVMLNDMLCVKIGEREDFYRLFGPAFEATYTAANPTAAAGGANKKKKPAKKASKKKPTAWESLHRKVTTKSGEVRTLYKCSTTGEVRVKRMAMRGGKRVASYVKP